MFFVYIPLDVSTGRNEGVAGRTGRRIAKASSQCTTQQDNNKERAIFSTLGDKLWL